MLRARAAAPSTRVFALTTGTLGLLAVGVLILTVTPRRQESPIAISATTSPTALAGADSSAVADTESRADGRVPAFAARGSNGDQGAAESPTTVPATATPIGTGRLAIVTRAAIGDADVGSLGDTIAVVLPSGAATVGDVVHTNGEAIVIEIGHASVEPGHEIARHRPHDREIVTVMSSPPITVAYGDVDGLEVGEGTAVLDDDGALVGLCSRSDAGPGVRLIELSDEVEAEATGGR